MSGSVRHVIERDGFRARLIVPVRLRPMVGKRELSETLGGDRRTPRDGLVGVCEQRMKVMQKRPERLPLAAVLFD